LLIISGIARFCYLRFETNCLVKHTRLPCVSMHLLKHREIDCLPCLSMTLNPNLFLTHL
jgi:hypothetical protein